MHQNLNLQVLIDAYPRPLMYRWIHLHPAGKSTNIGRMIFGHLR